MIICPWCGTNYIDFQSNCKNCGGPLQAAAEASSDSAADESPHTPPPAPRPISDRYIWRLLFADGWAISAFVSGRVRIGFHPGGGRADHRYYHGFCGHPIFPAWILTFLLAGGGVIIWRYQQAQKIVNVLRVGQATQGQVVELQENNSVSVNGQHPWEIRYQFQAAGQDYDRCRSPH